MQNLKAAAFRAGVEVIEVNPAYTSTMGMVNYAHRYGISVHQGAAIAIARRSLYLSERPATRVARLPHGGDHVTFPVNREESRETCVVAMVDGFAADSSGANSASLVASQNSARYTRGSEFPAAVCYLKIAGEIPARESCLTLFETRPWPVKCHGFRNGTSSARIPPTTRG